MDIYELALIKTFCYAAVFRYPLTKGQLWRFLIWERKARPRFSLFLKTTDILLKKQIIRQIKGLFLLDKKYTWVNLRKKMEKNARNKLAIGQKVSRLLFFLPTIEFIGLTGKLSLGVAERDDDIDLLLITKQNTLWLTRFLVTGFLAFVGLKRQPQNEKFSNKVCVNMFIDKNHLRLPQKEQDLFSAHEIAQMQPLLSRNNCYFDFLEKNRWISRYLPNVIGKVTQVSPIRQAQGKRVPRVSRVKNTFFEKLAQKFQLRYMKKRRTTEVIRKGYVRFHPRDVRNWVLPAYNRLVQKHVACNTKHVTCNSSYAVCHREEHSNATWRSREIPACRQAGLLPTKSGSR